MLIPHSPQQVVPIYFITPRKCHLFGICSESLPKEVNFLTDEAELTGKGANETVSYPHHYFNSDNCNDLNLHCNNCRGQNQHCKGIKDQSKVQELFTAESEVIPPTWSQR